MEKENEKVVICSESDALATAVSEHPEVCRLAETPLYEIVRVEVREQCERGASQRCRFEVIGTKNGKK